MKKAAISVGQRGQCCKCDGYFILVETGTIKNDTDLRTEMIDGKYRHICNACYKEYLNDRMIKEYGSIENFKQAMGI